MRAVLLALALTGCAGLEAGEALRYGAPVLLQAMEAECQRAREAAIDAAETRAEAVQVTAEITLGCDAAFVLVERAVRHVD